MLFPGLPPDLWLLGERGLQRGVQDRAKRDCRARRLLISHWVEGKFENIYYRCKPEGNQYVRLF